MSDSWPVVLSLLLIAYYVVSILFIVDCIGKTTLTRFEKFVMVLLLLLLPGVGIPAYFYAEHLAQKNSFQPRVVPRGRRRFGPRR